VVARAGGDTFVFASAPSSLAQFAVMRADGFVARGTADFASF